MDDGGLNFLWADTSSGHTCGEPCNVEKFYDSSPANACAEIVLVHNMVICQLTVGLVDLDLRIYSNRIVGKHAVQQGDLCDVLLGDNLLMPSKIPSSAIRAKQSEDARIIRAIAYHGNRVAHCG